MLDDYDFRKRRIEDAAFNKWLFSSVYERNFSSDFTFSLAEEYKRKYEQLLKEHYSRQCDEAENLTTICNDNFFGE